LVTGGRGWYQEKGKPAQELHPGDVVEILPNVNTGMVLQLIVGLFILPLIQIQQWVLLNGSNQLQMRYITS
jgi:hypothetical protein